jgi:hypothetical protein
LLQKVEIGLASNHTGARSKFNGGVVRIGPRRHNFDRHRKLGMPIDAIASTIQSAVAPVFLFAGIGGILNIIGMRLNRSIDRTRVLESLHADANVLEHQKYSAELAMLERRIKHSNRATTLSVASALAVCLVVVLLFVSQILALNLGTGIALVFVVAMILLAGGLIAFLTEIQIAIGGRRVHRQHLRHPGG